MTTMIQVGTAVVSENQWEIKLGMVADHVTDRWGTHHVVCVGDEFITVDYIGPVDMKGIGWKVATPKEAARGRQYRETS